MAPEPLSTRDILEALHQRHPEAGGEWVLLEEALGCIDAWAINCFPSKKFERISYEIKISRSDFRREMRKPAKRQTALELSNRYYFAAPKGMIRPDELPAECGLLEVWRASHDGYACKVARRAPRRPTGEPDWFLFARLLRERQAPGSGRYWREHARKLEAQLVERDGQLRELRSGAVAAWQEEIDRALQRVAELELELERARGAR